MLEFEYTLAFYLLPLPALAWLILPRIKNSKSTLQVPRLEPFQLNTKKTKPAYTNILKITLLCLAWLSLIFSAAQPKWLSPPISLPISGRDLMLAVDLSGSMKEKDFVFQNTRINRLAASKIVVADFIEKRKGDRLGLIVFGEQAYLQTPLTFDNTTVAQLMQETFIGLAGEKATAIGDAIGIAIKRLNESATDAERILILVTDGANNAGAITPEKAAEFAADNKLKIYTIGIGADEQIVNTWFGQQRLNPSAELDEETLKLIAEKTGGRYFRARDTKELQKVYSLINKLEPIEQEQETFKPVKSLFYWPLTLMTICVLAIAFLQVANRGITLPEFWGRSND